MKRLLLFLVALIPVAFSQAQPACSDIFISEYVEGWYNNKALELYNPTSAPITLDNQYRLIRWSNGSMVSDQNPLYVLPLTSTIQPYSVMVMVQDTTKDGQDTMVWPELRKKATWLAPYDYDGTTPGGNVVFWNGDDAVSLQKKQNDQTWKDIDIFGEIGVRPLDWQGGTTGAWTDTKPYWQGTGAYLTKDQTLIRRHDIKFGIDRVAMSHYGDSLTGVFPNSFYAFAQYDSMPANYFDSLGTHWCDCKTSQSIHEIQNAVKITIQPNPVTNGRFTITSNSNITCIEVYSLVGESVYLRNFSSRRNEVTVTLNDLSPGIFLVRVLNDENQPAIRKVIIE